MERRSMVQPLVGHGHSNMGFTGFSNRDARYLVVPSDCRCGKRLRYDSSGYFRQFPACAYG